MITPVYILNTLIVLGIVVSAVLTVTAKRTLSSIICLAACGAFVSLEFIMLIMLLWAKVSSTSLMTAAVSLLASRSVTLSLME